MKKKIVSFLTALALAGAAFTACDGNTASKDSSESTKQTTSQTSKDEITPEKKDVNFGFIVSTLDGVFTEFTKALESECNANGISYSAKEAYSVSDKITALENFTLSGCNVILIQVDDAEALSPYIEEAQSEGVKIIALDTPTDTNDAFYICENYDYGYAIGKNAAEWINKAFSSDENVEVAICNAPFLPFLVERENGVRKAIEELAPNAKFVAEAAAGASISEGVTAGETWLQSNPEIDCVIGINDTGALGVYEAYKAADNVIFRGTVSTGIVSLAPDIVKVADELVQNGKTESKENYFPLSAITVDNVDDYLA